MRIFAFFRILEWFFIAVMYVWTIVAARLYPEQEFGKKLFIFRLIGELF